MQNIVKTFQPLCAAITSLIPDQIEVVIHDLKSGVISHIENPLSARRIGDSSLIDMDSLESDANGENLIGPYFKSNPDGSQMKSVTTIIRDAHEQAIALICINFRVTELVAAEKILKSLTTSLAKPAETGALMKLDWRESANDILAKVIRERSVTLASAKRHDKIVLMQELDKAGIFDVRGSTDYIAEVMSISRANLYALLKTARE